MPASSGVPGPGRDQHRRRGPARRPRRRSIASLRCTIGLGAELAEVLDQVVDERVVVVDDEHPGGPWAAQARRPVRGRSARGGDRSGRRSAARCTVGYAPPPWPIRQPTTMTADDACRRRRPPTRATTRRPPPTTRAREAEPADVDDRPTARADVAARRAATKPRMDAEADGATPTAKSASPGPARGSTPGTKARGRGRRRAKKVARPSKRTGDADDKAARLDAARSGHPKKAPRPPTGPATRPIPRSQLRARRGCRPHVHPAGAGGRHPPDLRDLGGPSAGPRGRPGASSWAASSPPPSTADQVSCRPLGVADGLGTNSDSTVAVDRGERGVARRCTLPRVVHSLGTPTRHATVDVLRAGVTQVHRRPCSGAAARVSASHAPTSCAPRCRRCCTGR